MCLLQAMPIFQLLSAAVKEGGAVRSPWGAAVSGCAMAQMGGHNSQWLCQSGHRRIKSKG